jgi:hypothetical protein
MGVTEGTAVEKYYRRELQTAIMRSPFLKLENKEANPADKQRTLKHVTFRDLEKAFGLDPDLQKAAKDAGISELIADLRRKEKFIRYEAERIFPLIDA